MVSLAYAISSNPRVAGASDGEGGLILFSIVFILIGTIGFVYLSKKNDIEDRLKNISNFTST